MIDSHCHLDLAAYDADRDAVLSRARAAGVIGILVPGIRPSTWPALTPALTQLGCLELPRIALGIHPQIVPWLTPEELALTEDELAAQAVGACAIAIGECGLDGTTARPELQEVLLRMQIRVARQLRRPLVMHCFRAHDRLPRILREERAHECGGVLHSYSGGADLVPVYRDLGFSFSFAGPVTYPTARKPLEAVRVVPEDLLLVETDGPDQAPTSHRGERSEPSFLPEIVAAVAAARDADPTQIAAVTELNARTLFKAWSPPNRS
jgi:TatD DNase family protein